MQKPWQLFGEISRFLLMLNCQVSFNFVCPQASFLGCCLESVFPMVTLDVPCRAEGVFRSTTKNHHQAMTLGSRKSKDDLNLVRKQNTIWLDLVRRVHDFGITQSRGLVLVSRYPLTFLVWSVVWSHSLVYKSMAMSLLYGRAGLEKSKQKNFEISDLFLIFSKFENLTFKCLK